MTTVVNMNTTTIKALLLLFVMNLAVACSDTKNSHPGTEATAQNADNNPKSDESIVVNGMVKAIEFGKDGYTAEVQTEKEGNYAALVSIVNVGGQEHYKSCEVGDHVILKGVPAQLGDVKQLMVKEIINITSAQAQLLEAKYNKIQPNESCWQINKVLDLHTQPDLNSKVEGKHFAGEVLKVLGTKMINNQLWVNVAYQLKVKAGYEDQFADGRVTPSGLPTGWIGGAETPKINCK